MQFTPFVKMRKLIQHVPLHAAHPLSTHLERQFGSGVSFHLTNQTSPDTFFSFKLPGRNAQSNK